MYLELDDDSHLTSFSIKKGYPTTKILNYNSINFSYQMLISLICWVSRWYMQQKHVKFEAYNEIVKL